jgi:hypothetical protein
MVNVLVHLISPVMIVHVQPLSERVSMAMELIAVILENAIVYLDGKEIYVTVNPLALTTALAKVVVAVMVNALANLVLLDLTAHAPLVKLDVSM